MILFFLRSLMSSLALEVFGTKLSCVRCTERVSTLALHAVSSSPEMRPTKVMSTADLKTTLLGCVQVRLECEALTKTGQSQNLVVS